MNHEEGGGGGEVGRGRRCVSGEGDPINSSTGRCAWRLVDDGGAPVGKDENFPLCGARKEARKEGRPSLSVPAGLLCIIATVVRETEG